MASSLRSFTYTYSGSAENQSNPAADVDAVADASAVTDDQFYVLNNGGMATAGDGDGICTSQSVPLMEQIQTRRMGKDV